MQPQPTENHNTESAPGNRESNHSNSLIRTCPICTEEIEGKTKHLLYNVEVCRSCYYGFASNRHLAFAIDFVFLFISTVSLTLAFTQLYRLYIGYAGRPTYISIIFHYLLLVSLVAFRDGIRGHSPGKFLMGVQVVNIATLAPIGFVRSFIRNLPIAVFLIATFFVGAVTTIGEYIFAALLFWFSSELVT